jgi:hypothetical protein
MWSLVEPATAARRPGIGNGVRPNKAAAFATSSGFVMSGGEA